MSYNDTTVDDMSYNDITVDDMSYNYTTGDDISYNDTTYNSTTCIVMNCDYIIYGSLQR